MSHLEAYRPVVSNEDSTLIDEIKKLKKEKNALIVAHFYQRPEIQDLADKVGDSLELAKYAHESTSNILVFAGVKFMAETAKILNPELKVLLPDLEAGCGLADSCTPDEFRDFKALHKDRVTVSYINTSAEIKAMSDYICTSSNALKVIQNIPEDKKILFAPDKNLGRYLQKVTGRDIICWDGVCYVHEAFSFNKILDLKLKYPNAEIIAHPESDAGTIGIANFIGSTSALIKYVEQSASSEFIIATEGGILHEIQKRVSNKKMIAAPTESENACSCSECAYMKVNTLQKIRDALYYEQIEIELSDSLLIEAKRPLLNMIESMV